MDSLKKYLIRSCYAVPLLETEHENVISVITPAGVIIGKPISDSDDSSCINASLAETLTKKLVSTYRSEHNIEVNQPLDGNDGCFLLKDAKLISNNVTYNFNVLTVFYDQVIAITVGSVN